MLEGVGAPRRSALRVQNVRLGQSAQIRLKGRLVDPRDGGEQLVGEFPAEDRRELGHVPPTLHAVQASHHQILERAGDLVPARTASAVGSRLVTRGRFLHHLGELFDEQRHPAGPVVHLLDCRVRDLVPRLPSHQVADLTAGQARQGQAGLVVHGRPRRLELGAEREHGQDAVVRELGGDLAEELQGGRIDPVQVLDDEEDRAEGGPDV